MQPELAAACDRDDVHRDDVRRAVAAVRGKLPGEVAGVEIERKDGRWQYEFRVVDSQGGCSTPYINARNEREAAI
jgi:uncharacterized membrane protein YkoI